MKRIKKITVLLTTLSLFPAGILTSCKKEESVDNAPSFVEKDFIDFTKGEPNSQVLVVSDNTTNGGVFGCMWSKNNVKYDDSGMNISITYDNETELYYSGELRTNTPDGQFNRGYFGVEMKVAKTVGTASTFFLYTGEYEGNPHDEIDIEFLGKDTTKVQFNYYGGDDTGHEYMYDLGFDASEGFHKYGFYWGYDQIVWYVDGVAVHKATENIPFHDMRMYTNFWNGTDENGQNITGWMGQMKKSDCPTTCYYKKITYANADGIGFDNIPEGKPNINNIEEKYKVSMMKNGFTSGDNNTSTKNGDYYDISLTQSNNKFYHVDPINYAFYEFGDVLLSVVKVKNLDNVSYPFYFMFVESGASDDKSGLVNLVSSVQSQNGTSRYINIHSTSIEFTLGASDVATFVLELRTGVKSYSKMQIIPDAKTQETTVTRNFQIQDWFFYDKNPVESSTETTYETVGLLDRGFDGGYAISDVDNGKKVEFTQNVGGYSYMAPKNISEIKVSNPKFVVFKAINNSEIGYQVYFEMKNGSSVGQTGGGCISTLNGSSRYERHGSSGDYFYLGASDTVEFRLLLNSTFTSYDNIKLYAAPGASVKTQASFTITDWYIAQEKI